MSVQTGVPDHDEIARVAYTIWESEGRPEGCDHEHWRRARQLIEEGRVDEAGGPRDEDTEKRRPVQVGFEDTAPGMVPKMKDEPGEALPKEPRGRFAEQLAELPDETSGKASRQTTTPGPRNPEPVPPMNAEGYVTVPSLDDVAGQSVGDDPRPPSAVPRPKRRRAKDAAV